MIFDTHAHYDDKAFDEDRFELLEELNKNGVGLIIDPGCDLESSQAAIELAERYDFVYAAVGIHPEELDKFSPESLEKVTELAKHPKCVAIGEVGLDYYWDDSHKEEQKELFRRQIELSLSLNKPLIIHDRDAHGDCMETLRDYKGTRGVFHCYSGSAEMAKELLKAGWYLGFDGPITYKNARRSLEVLELCPLDRMLVETDSPYLSPVPMRGKRNNSGNIKYIVEKISQVKGITPEEVERITMENGCRLFGIEGKA
jgi:TatD DNase family protein